MVGISAPVGEGHANRREDVRTVQSLLNGTLVLSGGGVRLDEDGHFGDKTSAAIFRYQSNVLRLSAPDGVVDPGGPTLRSLVSHATPAPLPVPPTTTSAAPGREAASGSPPGSGSYVEAARTLDCEAAAIEAVAVTETKRQAFDDQGRPTILFERHKFSEFSGGRFDGSHPDISNASPGGYGKFSEQYGKLERAMALDESAALKSCSWGKFQIMGFNHVAAGFPTVHAFVEAMKASEAHHLSAFVSFVKANRQLLRALQQKDWATFARHYNGANYAINHYDVKMRDNYNRIANATS